MGRLVDTGDLNNLMMVQKLNWGVFATPMDVQFSRIIADAPTVEAYTKEDLKQIARECWDAGVNMAGEYQGVWVRFRDIEAIVNKVLGGSKNEG